MDPIPDNNIPATQAANAAVVQANPNIFSRLNAATGATNPPAPITATPTPTPEYTNSQGQITVGNPPPSNPNTQVTNLINDQTSGPLSPESTYQNLISSNQKLIDTTNASFAAQLNEQGIANDANSKAAEYAAAAGGMMGTPAANDSLKKTANENSAASQVIQANQQQAVAKILSDFNSNAISLSNSQSSNDANAIGQIQSQQANQQAAFKQLAGTSNLTWQDFQAAYPQSATDALTATGMDPGEAQLLWNGQKTLSQQIAWQAPVTQADGSLLFYGIDPTTGKLTSTTIQGQAAGKFTYKVTNDGTLLRINSLNGAIDQFSNGQWGTPTQNTFGANPGYNKTVAGGSSLVNTQTGAVTTPGATGQNGPGATLGDFFDQYAPKTDGNDPVAYTNAVATALGVDPSTPLTQLASRVPDISNAIATHEGFFSGDATSAVSDNNPGALNFANQPGATQDGRWAKFPTLSAGWQALQNDIQSRIEQASGLSHGDYQMAEQLANGQLGIDGLNKILGGGNSSNPSVIQRRSNLLSLASQINPNFNEAQWEQGQKFGSNAATQKTLAAIGAVDQTFGIISGLVDNAVNTGIPALNKIVVPGVIDIGDVSTSNFATTATALADELSGVLGYGSATDMKLQLGIDLTNPTQSPEQFKTNLNTVKQLVENRKNSLQAQIWQGTGAADSTQNIVTAPDGTQIEIIPGS